MKVSLHLNRSVATTASTSTANPKTAPMASTMITAVRETAWGGAVIQTAPKFIGKIKKNDNRDCQNDQYP